jgi:Rrf2 family transcriptional regulator, cysteine metabolism repressor
MEGRMKLTTRSEYALLALIYLARHMDQEFISVDTIGEATRVPPRFLEQILLALKRSRYVRSQKGQHGGYGLAKPADRIALSEIIRCLDGALAPTESASVYFYESTPIEGERKLLKVFRDIRDYVSDKLETTRLSDVC